MRKKRGNDMKLPGWKEKRKNGSGMENQIGINKNLEN